MLKTHFYYHGKEKAGGSHVQSVIPVQVRVLNEGTDLGSQRAIEGS